MPLLLTTKPPKEIERWIFHVVILSWYDGDTATVDMRLGMKFRAEMRLRLAHVNCDEIDSKDPAVRARAVAARDRSAELCPPGTELVIETTKPDPRDKFERYLTEIPVTVNGVIRPLSAVLIEEKLGVPYEGGKR